MKIPFSILFFVCISFGLFGQIGGFENTVIDVGNIGLNITNVGTFGRPDVRNDPQGEPSCEYPINSGVEHLFESGLWIGAYQDGQLSISTAAIDATAGYSTGAMGFEFTPLNGASIKQRSSLTESEFFSINAISHQDVITKITDANTIIPGTAIPIDRHNTPLGADVNLETYAWNFSFADFFVILNYEITNNSTVPWDSVYLGLWTDFVVRNVNVSTDSGVAFFNKSGGGYLPEENALYVFDVSGDPGFTNSYAASQFLGIDWRNKFIHPSNAQTLIDEGLPEPKVNANFWNFRTFDGTDFSAPFDLDNVFIETIAYEKMKESLDFNNPAIVTNLQNESNRTQLLSVGPLVEVAPGETFNFALAIVCAKQLEVGGTTGPEKDTEEAREELIDHLGWAKRTFNGEDLNENGLLDAGEDLNENEQLDRFILPEPPAIPETHIEVENNAVSIYWDKSAQFSVDPISKEMDFEGYRLYRTKVGNEFTLDMLGNAELVAQWDKGGNAVGFNNGFDNVLLSNPKFFEDDTTAYCYKFTNTGLLNGWQYMYILTSFDEGNSELGLESLESSFVANAKRVFIGTPTEENADNAPVGVYPNPYRINAAWNGTSARSKKIHFYNLPAQCSIRIYTLAGDLVAEMEHNSDTYFGEDIQWYADFGGDVDQRIFSGGEHAWDLLSEANQAITQGIYLYTVKNSQSGEIQRGQFAVLK